MSGGGSHTATKALGEDALKCVLVAFGSSLLRREPLLPPPPKKNYFQQKHST